MFYCFSFSRVNAVGDCYLPSNINLFLWHPKKSSFAEPYIVCVTRTSGGGMLKERERKLSFLMDSFLVM